MTVPATERRSPLGEYIAQKREEADLTQDELAGLMHCSQPAVSAWEMGARTPKTRSIAALARALPGASVEEMVRLIDEASAS